MVDIGPPKSKLNSMNSYRQEKQLKPVTEQCTSAPHAKVQCGFTASKADISSSVSSVGMYLYVFQMLRSGW